MSHKRPMPVSIKKRRKRTLAPIFLMPRLRPEQAVGSFRIFPVFGRPHYFTVTIWKSRTQLRRLAREPGLEAACVRHWDHQRHFGALHFAETFISPCVVAHEAFHAALHWARRMKVRISKKTEEKICSILDRIVEQFYRKFKTI